MWAVFRGADGERGGGVKNSKLEVHEHSYVSGPNANKSWLRRLVHSHEGGNKPHEHEHSGPACYTIDKDEWLRATGLKGGGRKKFTKAPTGPQMSLNPCEPMTFEVIVHESAIPAGGATGPGIAPIARIELAFGARARMRKGAA